MAGVELYKQLAEYPSLTSAQATTNGGVLQLHLQYTVRDHVRLLKRQCSQTVHITHNPEGDKPTIVTGPMTELASDVVFQGHSPSGTYRVIFRSIGEDVKTQKHFIEVWKGGLLTNCQEVTTLHRTFLVGETFGNPSWSQDEKHLVYTADGHLFESEKPKDETRFERYRWFPHFGEQLPAQNPAIFLFHVILNTKEGLKRISRVTADDLESTIVYAQPVFAPNTKDGHFRIFCTGYETLSNGRRLGLIYCTNRLSGVYDISFPNEFCQDDNTVDKVTISRVSNSTISARSPRVSYKSHQLVYLSTRTGGPHNNCSVLHAVSLSKTSFQNDSDIIVDVVDRPKGTEFPGLFLDQLIDHPFMCSEEGKTFLVTSSIKGSTRVALKISIPQGEVEIISEEDESYDVMCTDGIGGLYVSKSSLVSLPKVMRSNGGGGGKHDWKVVTLIEASDLQQKLDKLRTKTLRLPQEAPTELVLTIPPHHKSNRRLILSPHGGPHSCSTNTFSPTCSAFALLGYTFALVNYPGSTGFGRYWLEYLTKHLIEADVDVCYEAIQFLSRQGYVNRDPKNWLLLGGSHGGFIITHLTSRYPDSFGACVIRNPVTDLVAMASGGSDIPDWCFAETGLNYSMTQDPPSSIDENSFSTLRNLSPISNAHNVKTPTLLLLGQQDERVSHQQGLAWYYSIRNQAPTQVMMFPKDSHPLSSIEAELTTFEATLRHFEMYT